MTYANLHSDAIPWRNLTIADLAKARDDLEASMPPVPHELLEWAATWAGRMLLVPICAGSYFGRARLVVLERMPQLWHEQATKLLRASGGPTDMIELVPARSYAEPRWPVNGE